MHEETAEHFLSDCDVLAQITVFRFMSKDGGILNKDMTGCILENEKLHYVINVRPLICIYFGSEVSYKKESTELISAILKFFLFCRW